MTFLAKRSKMYKFKSTTIEVVYYKGYKSEADDIINWVRTGQYPSKQIDTNSPIIESVDLDTPGVCWELRPGDYVVKHHNMFFVMEPHRFHQIYELNGDS